jgi:murein DD-endopeptidase MepM/ murein hydrolase activator NlpD
VVTISVTRTIRAISVSLPLFGCLIVAACFHDSATDPGDFQYPLARYRVQQPFANPNPLFGNLYHSAEDARGKAGTPVHTIADGEVSFSAPIAGYGWTIIIDHRHHNFYSLYAHVSTRRPKATSGQVSRGDVIAYIADDDEDGSGGDYPDWRPHLHFGLRKGSRADYPDYGDARWMAGYTSAHPTQLGWLEPSQLIKEN